MEATASKYSFEIPFVRTLFTMAGASGVRGLMSVVTAPRIFIGIQALGGLVDNAKSMASNDHAMIITDKVVLPSAERVKEALTKAGFQVDVWDEVQPEAPLDNVLQGVEAVKASGASFLVAVGGGSAIDSAKVMWCLYEKPETDFHVINGTKPLGLRKKAFFAAVPTTAGTGSEATAAAVITDSGHKMSVNHPEFVPDIAVLDPRFTVSLPPLLTMWTGLDALAHAVGGYLSFNWGNEYTEGFALQAIKLVFKYLPRCIEDGRDLEARQKMLVASNLAGLAFGNGAPGIDHALGHTIGHEFGLHHGLSVGAFLPYTFEFYARHLDKADELARELNYRDSAEFLASLIAFYDRIGFSYKFSAYQQVTEEAFNAAFKGLVEWAMMDICTILSPIPITPKDYEEIIRASFTGQLQGVK